MEVQTKKQILDQLEVTYHELLHWLRGQADDQFDRPEAPGKWSAGQHADHLVKSTKPLRKGLSMPKIALRTTFGVCNRAERSFDEVLEKYRIGLAEGGKAYGRYLPDPIRNEDKWSVISNLENEMQELRLEIEKWKEEHLSKYILPHPLIGKLTVREMLYFSIFHVQHHLAILRNRY